MKSNLRYVQTSQLSIAYQESGNLDGQPVIFLRGWPDCVMTWNPVVTAFQDRGYHIFVPSLRGFGHTHFLSDQTRRTGSFEAFATDIKEFIDVLGLKSVIIVGQDWGGFTALTMSSLWGKSLISAEIVLSEGWQTFNQLSLKQVQDYWYQWYMITKQGKNYIEQHHNSFITYMWQIWSPSYQLNEESKATLEQYINNEDWSAITLDCYRSRWGYAPQDSFYNPLRQKIEQNPSIDVPTLNIVGSNDPCTDISMLRKMDQYFSGPFTQEFWPEIGHFIQREAPEKLSQCSLTWLDSVL